MTINQHAHIYSLHTSNFIFGQIIFLKILSMQPLILSMVVGFFWSPAPHLYRVRFAYRLLGGTKVLELLLHTPHVRGQFYQLASRIFRIGCVDYTYLFVRKVPFEVPHNRAVALFMVGMYFWGPFFLIKRRSLLDALSSSTLSPLLASSNAHAESF